MDVLFFRCGLGDWARWGREGGGLGEGEGSEGALNLWVKEVLG